MLWYTSHLKNKNCFFFKHIIFSPFYLNRLYEKLDSKCANMLFVFSTTRCLIIFCVRFVFEFETKLLRFNANLLKKYAQRCGSTQVKFKRKNSEFCVLFMKFSRTSKLMPKSDEMTNENRFV